MPSDQDRPRHSPTADVPAGGAAAADAIGKPATKTPAASPQLPGVKRRSVSRAAWFGLVTGVVVLIFMLIFILQNNVPTQFTFLAWTFSFPLGVAVLFAAIAGALITAAVGTVRMIVLGRSVRTLEHKAATGT